MIIFNLIESQNNVPKVRELYDLEECKGIFEKVIKIGSRAKQPWVCPRSTLIKMWNAKEKWDIIGKARAVKHEQNQVTKN